MICCFRFIGLKDKYTLYGENAQIFVVASCCVVVAFCCAVLHFVVVCTLFRGYNTYIEMVAEFIKVTGIFS